MIQKLKPYAIGALILFVALWCFDRWQEFRIIRADIAFLHPQIEAQRARLKAADERLQQAQQAKPTPTPSPEPAKKDGAK